MITPYPLESPPPLPPLDQPWDDGSHTLLSGRRARIVGEGVALGEGILIQPTETGGVRRFLALEEPCAIWEAERAGSLAFRVRFPAEDLRLEQDVDRTRFWLSAPSTRSELNVAAIGGTLSIAEDDGGLLIQAAGGSGLRVVAFAASSELDRERSMRSLARKGFHGLLAQRREHRSRLLALATALQTPDRVQNDAFLAMTEALDAELTRDADGVCSFAAPLRIGGELLARGVREPVRDVLRAPFTEPDLLALFAAYADWCGEDDFVRKHWQRAEQAVRDAVTGAERGTSAELLLPVAEALGDGASVASLEGILASSPRSAPRTPGDPAHHGPWRIRPNALERAVVVAPELREEWPEMTLERLRIGDTRLDLRMRRRPAGIAVKARLTHGPALSLQLAPWLPYAPVGVLLADEQFPGPTIRFVLESEAEGVWLA